MSTWGTEPSQNPPTGPSGEATPTPPTYGAPQPNPGYPPAQGQPPYGYPQQPYGQQQPYPTQQQQPYGAPQAPYGAPQQPYGAPQPYGTPQPYPQQAAPAKKSPLLGRIALALVVTTAALATYTMGPMMTVANQLIIATGSTDLDSEVFSEALMSSASGPAMLFQLASTVGTVAMVIGLIAGIIGRGRASGFIAFVLGLLTPVIYIIYAIILLMPAIQAVS
ncbi:hypothetical protein [Propionicimonas sp.]|uniref:hypothetical protein n=1 Tax=Propionicimonas sp. TaxID=1955623 RepID=UPI0017E98CC4|nr:hypothetical protein [Propionicimonas sp.]MBU3976064.1 hypothetical protein [Actinomycetota bacterium]MBA3020877.1 hypothetical protein [Propionicimonas sp.]MBU3985254.1 hypothetical protein [Actinomycetota bacterium]MBU4008244.1 hypothetical protein [Actinomycetota bacterium]MBU4064542.1 hypothetical protein [Actinomycetota bacterium]